MPASRSHNCSVCPIRLEGVFCDLPQNLVNSLNSAKTTNHYKRGQVIFYEGNSPTGLFCIYSGKVKLCKNGADGHEVIVRISGPGDLIGYRSILTEENYSATAEVLEDAEICFIDRHFFHKLIAQDSALALKIIHRLGHELSRMQSQLSDLVNKSVRQRFAQLLLALARTHGKKDSQGTLLEIRLSRAELASMVGATTETVIRLLSEFHDTGYVVLEGKRITVARPEELAREIDLDA